MPGFMDIVYFLILLAAIFFSFRASNLNIEGLTYLRVLLVLSFVNEMISMLLKWNHLNPNIPHYFYIPVEYSLLVLFYSRHFHRRGYKEGLFISAAVVVSFCVYKMFRNEIYIYPGFVYNISCGFNTFWAALLLLNLKVTDGLVITSIPMFWILTALLLFYSGIFFFNVGYSLMIIQNKMLADAVRTFISTTLNIFLYLLLIYGFACSYKTKKY